MRLAGKTYREFGLYAKKTAALSVFSMGGMQSHSRIPTGDTK